MFVYHNGFIQLLADISRHKEVYIVYLKFAFNDDELWRADYEKPMRTGHKHSCTQCSVG
jgi:hypothetical protein